MSISGPSQWSFPPISWPSGLISAQGSLKQGLLALTGTGLLRLGEHFVAGPYAMQKSYTTAAGSTVGLVWWTCGLSGGWGKGCLQFPGCLFLFVQTC